MAKHIQRYCRLVLFTIMIAVMFFMVSTIGYRVLAEKNSGNNPHELKNLAGKSACTSCHSQTPETAPVSHTRACLPSPDRFSAGPTSMCMPCHEGSMDSHPLDVFPKYAVPADLPLTRAGGISCCTCHYTHGSLKTDNPTCSVSFLERMFGSDRLKKSFLLRRNNCNGELCKACHESY